MYFWLKRSSAGPLVCFLALLLQASPSAPCWFGPPATATTTPSTSTFHSFCLFCFEITHTASFVHLNRNTKSTTFHTLATTTTTTTTTTCSGASATCPTGYTKDSDGTKCYIRRWFSMMMQQETNIKDHFICLGIKWKDENDEGDNDDDGCRTGQSGWEDGNSKCKSEGDVQLATIKWAIIKSIELSDYIKLLDYIELSDYIESEGDAQLATIKWVIDNWLDTVSMRK